MCLHMCVTLSQAIGKYSRFTQLSIIFRQYTSFQQMAGQSLHQLTQEYVLAVAVIFSGTDTHYNPPTLELINRGGEFVMDGV